MTTLRTSTDRTLRLAAAACAAVILAHAPVRAGDFFFDGHGAYGGLDAAGQSRGGREILRDAQRGPSVTSRFGLPQLSGPLPPLALPRPPQEGGLLASPPGLGTRGTPLLGSIADR